jgi:Fe-S-cluster containining protein
MMSYGDLVARVDFDMQRDSAFSYACHACNRCCHNKAIRVTPYETLMLARHIGLSTTDFISAHTEAGGTILRSRDNGDCGFLGERGCTVHPARPLACRIYPLARWVDADGTESFGHLAPHPQTDGVYGRGGIVQDYLDHQGIAPFFALSDLYGALYQRMVTLLEEIDSAELDKRADRRAAIDKLPAGSMVSLWTDIDATLVWSGKTPPSDVDEAIGLHIGAIEAWLEEHLSKDGRSLQQPAI